MKHHKNLKLHSNYDDKKHSRIVDNEQVRTWGQHSSTFILTALPDAIFKVTIIISIRFRTQCARHRHCAIAVYLVNYRTIEIISCLFFLFRIFLVRLLLLHVAYAFIGFIRRVCVCVCVACDLGTAIIKIFSICRGSSVCAVRLLFTFFFRFNRLTCTLCFPFLVGFQRWSVIRRFSN